jgi:GPH family glycoside/pentoside/hexuronide:cation symporter
MQSNEVTKPQILAFAIGEIGIHVPFMSTVLFMMYFYTEAAGLSAATAGLIFLAASVWDAITDPPMGWIAERTRTRWGRCRPYFLFGAPPLAASLVLLYYVPALSGGALIL